MIGPESPSVAGDSGPDEVRERPSGNLRRFSQIGRVLVRHGFGFVFDARSGSRESKGIREVLAPNFSVRLRRALEDLGPTFVKFGQLLSTRPDVLPEGVLTELQRLQDTASPMPFDTVVRLVEQELRAPVEEIFDELDPVPLGSASIGQVHRAVLRGGQTVAIKVQRPNARRRVEADLTLMKEFSSFLDRRLGNRMVIDVRGLVDEFEGVIRRELDYTAEARAARRFAINFEESAVVIPKVYTARSTSRLMTMEYIRGTRFHDIEPLSMRPAERRRVAEMGAEAIFEMAFDHGFFHGDPHPGNLILTPEGNLALLDFGMVGFLSRGDVDALSRLFISVINRDAPAALRALEGLGVRYDSEVRDDLIQNIGEFLHKYSGLSVGEVTLGQALSELIGLARRYRLRVPPVFPLLAKALITAEGLARSIDPTINVYEVARPYARRLLSERYSPGALAASAEERSYEYARYASEYPEMMRQLLSELSDGELEVQLKHGGIDELVGEVDVLANRLVFAVVTAALLIGSSMLGAFDLGGPLIPYIGISVVSFIGFTLSMLLAAIVIFSIFRSDRL